MWYKKYMNVGRKANFAANQLWELEQTSFLGSQLPNFWSEELQYASKQFPTFHTSLTHLKCNLIKSLSCLKHINGVALADPSFHFFHSHYLLRANMCSSMEHKVLHNGVFLNGNSLKNTFFSSNIDYSQLSWYLLVFPFYSLPFLSLYTLPDALPSSC